MIEFRAYRQYLKAFNGAKLFLLLCILSFYSCDRIPFVTTVEFRGKVYYGRETADGKVVVLGPLSNASVVLIGSGFRTTTDAKGKYTLEANVPRRFNTPSYEIYTLEASGTSDPHIYPEGNYISAQIDVDGRPGDVIHVRDFLLYRHKK